MTGLFGVLNLDKPLHCTSHDIVAKVRRKLQLKKVGHAGTLDPLASGVLPVCVGDATRLIEYFPSDKRYRAQVTFGHTTLTWDAEGDRIASGDAQQLTAPAVEALLEPLCGIIQQQVPPHAAVHVNGKKLYEYARKGIPVTLPIRAAEIFSIALIAWDTTDLAHPVATLDIHCGSGTYIRSIAQHLGQVSGAGAYLSGLVRTFHGAFDLTQSVSFDAWLAAENPTQWLQNPAAFISFPQLPLTLPALTKIRHGMKLQPEDCEVPIRNNRPYLLMYAQLPVAVAMGEETGRLKPVKVFQAP